MKALMAFVAGIALIACVVSANLWSKLHAVSQLNEQLRTQLAQATAFRPSLAAPQAVAAPASATPAMAGTAAQPAPVSTDPQASATADRARSTAALSSTLSALTASLGGTDQDLMKDAEYRKARITQMRMQIEKSYPGLAEELGLSEREADKLFELIATNQLATTAELTARTANGTPDFAAMTQRQSAMQKEQEEAIRTMLGAGKYQQWQDYQSTRPARQQVTALGGTLATAGVPLSDAQSRALTSVMIAEQQRQRQQPPRLPPPDPGADARTRTAQLLEDSNRRTEENNRNVLEAVAPHVNAKQLAAIREQFEQQNAQRRQTLSRLQESGTLIAPPVITTAPAQRP